MQRSTIVILEFILFLFFFFFLSYSLQKLGHISFHNFSTSDYIQIARFISNVSNIFNFRYSTCKMYFFYNGSQSEDADSLTLQPLPTS